MLAMNGSLFLRRNCLSHLYDLNRKYFTLVMEYTIITVMQAGFIFYFVTVFVLLYQSSDELVNKPVRQRENEFLSCDTEKI